jgi:hypothetical protein
MNRFSAKWAVCFGIGALSFAAGAGDMGAQRGAVSPATRPDTALSSARSDARDRARADSLRREVLRLATFAGFGTTPCGGVDMRTFERDSTGKAVPELLARLELLVLTHGVSASVDNESGRALLRAVVRMEAGGPGPRWDVLTGVAPRSFNPLLPTMLYNPEAKKCEQTPGEEPDGLILPPATGFTAPTDSGTPAIHVRHSAAGVNQIRDMFFARFGSDTTAVLRITRVNAHALWENYAIVSVVRERLSRGVMTIAGATTGSVYAMHRVGREWRLLAVVRTR